MEKQQLQVLSMANNQAILHDIFVESFWQSHCVNMCKEWYVIFYKAAQYKCKVLHYKVLV